MNTIENHAHPTPLPCVAKRRSSRTSCVLA